MREKTDGSPKRYFSSLNKARFYTENSPYSLTVLLVRYIVQLVFSGGGILQAYCFKCRKQVEVKNTERITLKNGRPAARGVCPSCGTKVFRIGKS
jgi:NAD-dependent SIR2 family protein deacetylase